MRISSFLSNQNISLIKTHCLQLYQKYPKAVPISLIAAIPMLFLISRRIFKRFVKQIHLPEFFVRKSKPFSNCASLEIIRIKGPVKLLISQGDQIELEGKEGLNYTISENELTIDQTKSKTIRLKTPLQNLNQIFCYGMADVEIHDMKSTSFCVGGNGTLQVKNASLDLFVASSSGNVSIEGSAKKVELFLSKEGVFSGENLVSDECTIILSGSSQAKFGNIQKLTGCSLESSRYSCNGKILEDRVAIRKE